MIASRFSLTYLPSADGSKPEVIINGVQHTMRPANDGGNDFEFRFTFNNIHYLLIAENKENIMIFKTNISTPPNYPDWDITNDEDDYEMPIFLYEIPAN
jgi:hypothetical protein